VIEVEVENRSGTEVDEAGAVEVAQRVLAAEGIESGELGLLFVGPDESRELKRSHLGVDEATDALAFPIDGLEALPPGLPRQLGDVVVCPQVCALEASSAKPPTPGERPGTPQASPGGDAWHDPLVHALLHLVGYDHGPEMEAREAVHR
jgi:ssRNA-specific RNase YbeY (16S rRNA maturation enzyme)